MDGDDLHTSAGGTDLDGAIDSLATNPSNRASRISPSTPCTRSAVSDALVAAAFRLGGMVVETHALRMGNSAIRIGTERVMPCSPSPNLKTGSNLEAWRGRRTELIGVVASMHRQLISNNDLSRG